MSAVMDSVLDNVKHARLIADMNHVCTVAGIPRVYVNQSMKLYCDAQEIDFVVNFRVYRDAYAGLLLTGMENSESRCMAIGGALLRNFIDTRLLPLNSLLRAVEDGTVPDPTVLIIPNLFVSSVGKSLPAWKIQAVYDLLLNRFTSNKPTVVAVESMMGLRTAYGTAFASHLSNHYK